jgi:hypothetical protein
MISKLNAACLAIKAGTPTVKVIYFVQRRELVILLLAFVGLIIKCIYDIITSWL